MTSFRVTCLDPGSEAQGWANIVAIDGKLRCLDGGHRRTDFACKADVEWYVDVVQDLRPGDALAIEKVEHAYGDKPDGYLIATKDQESQMVGIARYFGVEPVRMTAVRWRAALGIRPPKADQQIALAVEHIYGAEVRSMFTADVRVHVYDALGMAAVVAAQKAGSAVSLLDAATIFAIERLRTEEQHSRKVKKGVEALLVARLRKQPGWADAATVEDVGRLRMVSDDAAVAALKAIGRGKSATALAAKAILVRSGLVKAPKAKRQR